MSAKITTEFGHAVPPAPRHAVTVHIGPEWENGVQFGANAPSVVAKFKNTYPRTRPHRDIVQLSTAVLQHLGLTDKACLLFPSLQSAQQCAEYATSSKRDNGVDKRPVAAENLAIHAFIAKDPFQAVIFPADQYHVVSGFWSTVGVGITSRFAEGIISHLSELREVSLEAAARSRASFNEPVHETLRQRILSLQNRAPLDTNLPEALTTSDIFLYRSGMASIYKPHVPILSHSL